MQYYLLSVITPTDGTPPGPEAMAQIVRNLDTFHAELREAGAWVFAGGLHGPETATVLRPRDGDVLITDGPYAEGKEVVGGWALMQYDSLEEAVADQQEFAELHAKYWPEVTVISTLRQISEGPEAPGE